MLGKDIGKIIEATLASTSHVRLKVNKYVLFFLLSYLYYPHCSFTKSFIC